MRARHRTYIQCVIIQSARIRVAQNRRTAFRTSVIVAHRETAWIRYFLSTDYDLSTQRPRVDGLDSSGQTQETCIGDVWCVIYPLLYCYMRRDSTVDDNLLAKSGRDFWKYSIARLEAIVLIKALVLCFSLCFRCVVNLQEFFTFLDDGAHLRHIHNNMP